MKMLFPKARVLAYFTAPIRGVKGSSASKKDIHGNIEAGRKIAARISNYFGSMLNMYVPHNQDDLIQILWYGKKITVWDILEGDCQIVAQKDILIAWAPKGVISAGMLREIKTAKEREIPVVQFEKFDDEVAITILKFIYQIMERKIKGISAKELTEDLGTE